MNLSAKQRADQLAPDRPIAVPEFDRFGRSAFAEAIARLLIEREEREGLVVAVYGEWGDGKTSVLNLVRHYLKTADGVVPVIFNPWLVRTAEQLLPTLMATLAEATGGNRSFRPRDLAHEFAKYAEIAGHLDSRVAAAAKGLKAVSTTSVERQKAVVGRQLVERGKRIVVVIDDIDRLDGVEMTAMLKLVKLTADFPYVSYLLAFDDAVVSAALKANYADVPEGGRAFLEKIVQVPLTLPSPEVGTLEAFGLELVLRALDEGDISLGALQRAELERRHALHIAPLLATPRAAIRYANALRFDISLLRNEINTSDLVALAAIRTVRPNVYRLLPTFGQALLGTYFMTPSAESVRTEAQRLVEQGELERKTPTSEHVMELLKLLFPYFAQALDGRRPERWDPGSFETEQRIAGPRYFARAFTLRVARNEVSDTELQTLLHGEGEDITRDVRRFIDAGRGESLVAGIRRNAKGLPPAKARDLILALAENGGRLERADVSFEFQTPFIQAAIAMRQLMERVDPEARDATAHDAVAKANGVPFAAHVATWVVGGQDDERLISPNGRRRAVDELVARIANDATTGRPIYQRYERDAPLILALWAEYGQQGATDAYVRATLSELPENALDMLRTYAPYSFDTGVRTLGNIGREQYDAIAKVVDPAVFADALRAFVGESPAGGFPRVYGPAAPIDLARQFVYIHDHLAYGDVQT